MVTSTRTRAPAAPATRRPRAAKPAPGSGPAPRTPAGETGRAVSRSAAPRAGAAKAKAKRAPASAAPATAPSPGKAAKTRKSGRKTVRDSFNMPREDFVLLDRLKDVAKQAGRPAKKSELIRAGLHALSALDAAALVQALQTLPAVATGRPKRAPDA
jgi:hypothetical protein